MNDVWCNNTILTLFPETAGKYDLDTGYPDPKSIADAVEYILAQTGIDLHRYYEIKHHNGIQVGPTYLLKAHIICFQLDVEDPDKLPISSKLTIFLLGSYKVKGTNRDVNIQALKDLFYVGVIEIDVLLHNLQRLQAHHD